MLWVIPVAATAVAALAVTAGGALALLYTDPLFVGAGLGAIAAGLVLHLARWRRRRAVAVSG